MYRESVLNYWIIVFKMLFCPVGQTAAAFKWFSSYSVSPWTTFSLYFLLLSTGPTLFSLYMLPFIHRHVIIVMLVTRRRTCLLDRQTLKRCDVKNWMSADPCYRKTNSTIFLFPVRTYQTCCNLNVLMCFSSCSFSLRWNISAYLQIRGFLMREKEQMSF